MGDLFGESLFALNSDSTAEEKSNDFLFALLLFSSDLRASTLEFSAFEEELKAVAGDEEEDEEGEGGIPGRTSKLSFWITSIRFSSKISLRYSAPLLLQ